MAQNDGRIRPALYKRIGYVGLFDIGGGPRLRGYQQAVHDLGLDSDPQLILTGPDRPGSGLPAIDRLLKLESTPQRSLPSATVALELCSGCRNVAFAFLKMACSRF